MPQKNSAKLRIAFVGQEEYFKCHYETDLEDLFEVQSFQAMWHVDPEYYSGLISFKPDITFFFRGELIPPSVIDHLKGVKVGISTEPMPKLVGPDLKYTKDSLDRFKFFLTIFERNFDYIFHYDESSKTFFESQGVSLSGFLPLPIATGTYKPLTGSAPVRDILFLGRSSEHRERFLGALKRDFDVLHLAHGWPHQERVRSVRRDLLPLVGNFHIVLNIHAADELSWEPRVQQMLACGALVVSEPISPNEYLKPGIHFVEANTPQGLYDTCKDILSNPQAYEGIRTAGLAEVRSRLSTKMIFGHLIETIRSGAAAYPAPTISRFVPRLELLEVALEYKGFEHLVWEAIRRHA